MVLDPRDFLPPPPWEGPPIPTALTRKKLRAEDVTPSIAKSVVNNTIAGLSAIDRRVITRNIDNWSRDIHPMGLVETGLWTSIYSKFTRAIKSEATYLEGSWNTGPCQPYSQTWQRELTGQIECPEIRPIRLSPGLRAAIIIEKAIAEAILSEFWSPVFKVYRGFFEADSDLLRRDGICLLPVRPLSSWTINYEWAKTIVERGLQWKRATRGVVASQDFSYTRAAAQSMVSGALSQPEAEIIIIREQPFEEVKCVEVVS